LGKKGIEMKRLYFLISMFFLFPLLLNAQNKLVGFVTDGSNNAPLFYATVTLKILNQDKIIDFKFTDNDGKFQFLNTSSFPDSVLLSAAFLGFNQLDTLLVFSQKNQTPLRLKLSPKDNEIKEVEVKSFKNGIIINGDTTIYDPAVFTNGSEENVGDVLKKIPGVEVDEDGKITVGGKDVEKVLIEGDKFLDENRKGVLEGISAKDISKIEVISNYQEFDDLAGLGSKKEKQYAINIKLTDEAKSKINANGSLAGGYQNKYEADWSVFKFSKKLKLFFDLNSNNTGQHALTIYDYIKLEGGIAKFAGNHTKKDISIPKIFYQKNQRKAIQENYSSLNFSFQPNSKLSFNGFGFTYFGKSTTENNKEEIPLHLANSNFYQTSNDNQLLLTIAKLNLEYDFSKKTFLSFSNKILWQKEQEDLTNNTMLSDISFSDVTDYNNDVFNFSNQVNFRHLINNQNHLSIQFFSKWKNDETHRIIDSDSFLPFSLQSGFIPTRNSNQMLNNKVVDLDFNINYIRQIKNINLTSQAYWTNKRQQLNTSDIQIVDSFNFSNQTKIKQHFIGVKQEVSFQKNLNEFGIGLNYFHLLTQEEQTNQKNKNLFIPSAFMKLQFTKFHQSISLTYNHQLEIINLPQAIQSTEVQSLNKLFLFSLPTDQVTKGHNLDFFYTLFDAFSGTMFFAFSKYSNAEGIINSYDYFPTYEVRESVLSPNQELFVAGVILDKKIYKYSVGVKSKLFVGLQNGYSYVSDFLLLNKNKNVRFDFNLYSAWADSPINMEVGGGVKRGKSVTQNNEIYSSEFTPQLSLLGLHFDEKIQWKLGLISVFEKRGNQSNQYFNLNGYLNFRFSKSSKYAMSIEFNDLLNIKSPARLSASQVGNNYLITSNNILPGFVLLKLKLKI
jgi:hypothetical protein